MLHSRAPQMVPLPESWDCSSDCVHLHRVGMWESMIAKRRWFAFYGLKLLNYTLTAVSSTWVAQERAKEMDHVSNEIYVTHMHVIVSQRLIRPPYFSLIWCRLCDLCTKNLSDFLSASLRGRTHYNIRTNDLVSNRLYSRLILLIFTGLPLTSSVFPSIYLPIKWSWCTAWKSFCEWDTEEKHSDYHYDRTRDRRRILPRWCGSKLISSTGSERASRSL